METSLAHLTLRPYPGELLLQIADVPQHVLVQFGLATGTILADGFFFVLEWSFAAEAAELSHGKGNDASLFWCWLGDRACVVSREKLAGIRHDGSKESLEGFT